MILKLVWRNLWRNRSRTLITTSSVLFAVLLATVLDSWQTGVYDSLEDNMIGYYTGYLQIHGAGYWDERTLENAMTNDSIQLKALAERPDIKDVSGRLESFVLASSGDKSKGCFLSGIDPKNEERMISLNKRVIAGRYLLPDDKGVLLGEGLAKGLHLEVNDTILLMGQGYHGATAAGKYPIRGLLKFGFPDLNELFVFMAMPDARYFLSADSIITSYVIMPRDLDNISEQQTALSAVLGPRFEVLRWQEMLPGLEQHIKMCAGGGYIFIAILYVLVAFGIFGTLLMMMTERRREFSMMIAIGMQKRQLALMVLMESFTLALLGCLLGIVLSIPVTHILHAYPVRITGQLAESFKQYGFDNVMQASMKPGIYVGQGVAVLSIALILSFYPLLHVLKLSRQQLLDRR